LDIEFQSEKSLHGIMMLGGVLNWLEGTLWKASYFE